MSENLPALQHTVSDLEAMARQVAQSKLFGMDASQAFTLMLLAQAEGIHPVQAVRRYHIVQGRPAMRADAMLADMMKSGWVVKWNTANNDPQKQEAHFRHAVKDPEGQTVAFTTEDAKRAELWGKDLWKKYPAQMLRARLISTACRMLEPGIVAGIYTPEEAAEMEPMPMPIAHEVTMKKPARVLEPEVSTKERAHAQAPAREAAPAPEVVDRFRQFLKAFVNRINTMWLEHWTSKTGEVEPGFVELINPWQLSAHLLKWGREHQLIQAPDDLRPGQREKFAALLWDREKQATEDEAARYCRVLWRSSEKAIREDSEQDETSEEVQPQEV